MPKNGKALFLGEGEAQTTPKGGIKLWQWRRDMKKMRNKLHWITTLELVSWISAIKRAFDFFFSRTQVKWVWCSGSKFHVSSPARCRTQRQFQFLRWLPCLTIPHDYWLYPMIRNIHFSDICPSFQTENLLVRLDVHSRGHLQSWAVQGSTCSQLQGTIATQVF